MPQNNTRLAVAQVAVDIPIPRIFDYRVPAGMAVAKGDRVEVPFGPRSRIGLITDLAGSSMRDVSSLREISAVRADAPPLPEDWLDFAQFLSEYYQRPLGETVIQSLPPRLRSLAPLPREMDPWWRIGERKAEPVATRLTARSRILEALSRGPLPATRLLAIDGASPCALRHALERLRKDGAIVRTPARSTSRFHSAVVLNADQRRAVEAVRSRFGTFAAVLLRGVTGSGKTEVYLNLVAERIAAGHQVLVLVPEISLTPQLEARFRRAFPETMIVVLHSALGARERSSGWLAAARGEAAIVLGTRLAVLAPMPRLGLIVVDEEHDPSFKQQEGLRYSARDAAVWRARRHGCPVVLGSATPSLESWANADAGRYLREELSQRAVPGSRLPVVRTIDLNREPADHGFTPTLIAAIGDRLRKGEQSLVFINRRGYAPVLQCPACGWAAGCERCSAHLVFHAPRAQKRRRLMCHYCGAEASVPRGCPTCGNVDLQILGRGTQRVEETLAERFPTARIVRIDRDSARRRDELVRSLIAARDGAAHILVGTQLLAKGHDFPGLSLVGVLGADQGLLAADYRASERLYATLTQVAGRAGRREQPGEVLIQTRYPAHPHFASLARHDYPGFAAKLLQERREAGFPPFVAEAVLRAEAEKLDFAMAFLREARALAPAGNGITLYDPVPMQLTRRAGVERARLVVQSALRPALQDFLPRWIELFPPLAGRRVRWHVDVDPLTEE